MALEFVDGSPVGSEFDYSKGGLEGIAEAIAYHWNASLCIEKSAMVIGDTGMSWTKFEIIFTYPIRTCVRFDSWIDMVVFASWLCKAYP